MSSFDYEFDKKVYAAKKEKERKKELFDKNIKKHIVYLDEQGNVYKKKPKEENEDVGFKIVCIVMVIAMIIMLLK